MKSVFVESIGLCAPGLLGWEESLAVFRGEAEYLSVPLERYKPKLLPANERRRATELIRLAFRVCEEVIDGYDKPASELSSVFASSGGDYQVLDQISKALSLPEKMVSPTQFHNSVHNSAAGYWGIATGSLKASSSISAHDYSFASGLLEAVVQLQTDCSPLLFAVYDTAPPSPLSQKRKIPIPFATAFVLSSTRTSSSLCELKLSLEDSGESGVVLANEDLEHLRLSNPAARSLPLLHAIANEKDSKLSVECVGGKVLSVEVLLC